MLKKEAAAATFVDTRVDPLPADEEARMLRLVEEAHKGGARRLRVAKRNLPTIEHNGGQHDISIVKAEQGKTYTDERAIFASQLGLIWKASQATDANRGSAEATEAANKAKRKANERSHAVRDEEADEREKMGFNRSSDKYDGSKGGPGFHPYGGLSQACKDNPVVQACRAMAAAPGASARELEECRFRAAWHLLLHLLSTRELPKDYDALKRLAKSEPEREALEDLEHLWDLTLKPQHLVVAADLEGRSTTSNPLGNVWQLAAARGSFAPSSSTADEVVANVVVPRGQHREKRGFGAVSGSMDELEEEFGEHVLPEEDVYHQAGNEPKALKALAAQTGVAPPRCRNVHAAYSFGMGRHVQGQRRPGFSSDDGLGTNAETIAYILSLNFEHDGADDCLKQFKFWRALLCALRVHYLGS